MNAGIDAAPGGLTALPDHIIETIVRLLVNQRKNEEHKVKHFDLVIYLRDVLNLRATCVRLLDIVHATRLKLPCIVNNFWTDPELNSDVNQSLALMKRETNWNFNTLRFNFAVDEAYSGILTIMQQNESLFSKSVENLYLKMPLGVSANVFSLMQWLRRETLKPEADVFVCIKDPLFCDWEAVLHVGHLKIRGSLRRQFDYFVTEVSLRKFPNLSRLELPDIIFPVSKLNLLRNLRMLSIANLKLPEYGVIPAYNTQITDLKLSYAEISSVELQYFSSIICQCFPHLVYLCLLNAYRTTFADSDNLCLPQTCSTVETYSYMLPYFKTCKYVRYFYLKDYYPAVKRQMFDKQFLSILETRPSILAVSFCSEDQNATDILNSVKIILDEFRYLDVLSVDAASSVLNTGITTYLERQTEIEFLKVFKGEKLTINDKEYELILMLKDICKDKKLKLLIMGKTVLYKTAADICLLREINALEDFYNWSIKRGCALWESIEI